MALSETESLNIQVGNLERELRSFKRHIVGVAAAGEAAVHDESELIPFKAYLAEAERYWEEFSSTWKKRAELRGHIKEDKFPSEQWLNNYDELKLELRKARISLLTIESRKANVAPQQDISLAVNPLNTTFTSKAHLPKINIPRFSGDLIKWRHFKDTFESMVHNEPSLTEIEKFHYLIGSLADEAAAIISGFPVEKDSYPQAWEKLLCTYDNSRVLANLYLQKVIDSNVRGIKDEEKRLSTFLSTIADSIESFQRLDLEEPEQFILSVLALRALDDDTRRQFELSRNTNNEFPTSEEVISFVSKRLNALKLARNISSHKEEPFKPKASIKSSSYPNRDSRRYNSITLHASSSKPTALSSSSQFTSSCGKTFKQKRPHSKKDSVQTFSGPRSSSPPYDKPCPFCNEHHPLPGCVKFAYLEPQKRIAYVKGSKICANCLYEGHKTPECKSRWSCRYCKQRHHTLIHPISTVEHSGPRLLASSRNNANEASNAFIGFGASPSEVPRRTHVLGTLQALLIGSNNKVLPIRAILDPGSHHSFITAALARKLGTPIFEFKTHVTGLGGTAVTQPSGVTNCKIRPLLGLEEYPMKTVIVERISQPLPTTQLDYRIVERLSDLNLADPSFDCPGPIDLLLGVDIFPRIVNGTPQHSGLEELFLLPTVFGDVVMGSATAAMNNDKCLTFFTESREDISMCLKAFWEIEEPSAVHKANPEEELCERHFLETHTRDENGRYVVKLPLKPGHVCPLNNRESAQKRLYSMEKRFKNDQVFADAYKNFMKDYQDLEHMSPATYSSQYIIPHHGIWQQGTDGFKLRVVFDASSPSSGDCLNNILLAGPKLQLDLCNILINFRKYLIPISTDLVKMYRQILIHPDDRPRQHIFWREHPSQAVQEFELNTVTYGLRPSAFLAMRVVKQLVQDEGSNYPLASSRILSSMYVDDLVTGADSPEEALKLQKELIALFSKGGFKLSKWASTMTELLPENAEKLLLHEENSFHIKILGLVWDPKRDSFSYSIQTPLTLTITKRIILSSVARIFDPLGLVAPVIFLAKVLLQEVWKAKLDWDEPVPSPLEQAWHDLAKEWYILSTMNVPRYFGNLHHLCHVVGFCDASDKGYAAAVYVRAQYPNSEIKIHLVKAKTKVAPLKYVSIARLELCGALLLARLLSSIQPPLTDADPLCFTDSSVVLSWLRKPLHMLRVFEANRVSEIQSVVPINCWRHVKSNENPADIASRGCSPKILHENSLWWNGPSFLRDLNFLGNLEKIPTATELHTASHETTRIPADEWMKRFSSFPRLIRTTARILRLSKKPSPGNASRSSAISAEEYSKAKLRCAKVVQMEHFPTNFTNGTVVPKEYTSLSPFVDESGIVRVGGRLHNAPLEYSSRHPILLPRNSHFTQLVVDYMHLQHYHAGPTLTLALLRTQYWIPGSMKFIRGRIRRCVHCRIRNATPLQPMMSALPKERFSQFRAFINTGIDYAGPFSIKESRRRNAALGKSYLCIFVCMASKAVHLEAVSSMTTSAFLAALDRFVARRGIPETIFSDHGLNFLGASRFLKELYVFILKHEVIFSEYLSLRNIDWKFIPPRSPHFGGLWEAGVKSVKALLTGIIGKQALTFEELATAFTKIEGLLNSRPLCPLSEDASDTDYMTPGHLLIGSNISSIPEGDHGDQPVTNSSRWQSVQAHVNRFWNKWRLQYLNTLQQRRKWMSISPSLEVGDLVILLEKRSVVGYWPAARVIKTHPGNDGITRVVTVRTPSGNTFMRSVCQLIPLFLPKESNC